MLYHTCNESIIKHCNNNIPLFMALIKVRCIVPVVVEPHLKEQNSNISAFWFSLQQIRHHKSFNVDILWTGLFWKWFLWSSKNCSVATKTGVEGTSILSRHKHKKLVNVVIL